MKALKKKRDPIRKKVKDLIKKLDEEMAKEEGPDQEKLSKDLLFLETKHAALEKCNEDIANKMSETDAVTDAEMEQESANCDEIEESYLATTRKVKAILKLATPKEEKKTKEKDSHLNLPEVKIPKFSGEVKHWLSWWHSFAEIHENEGISAATKFRYLADAMKEKTRAHDVVFKYPRIPENYPKAIQALKDRFGKDEYLIDEYIRELQDLVIENALSRASKDKDKMSLQDLYDRIETSLNALESLGNINKEQFLFPMIESCLPIHVQRAWHRHLFMEDQNGVTQDMRKPKLERLLEFIAAEVHGEVSIARASKCYGASAPKQSEQNKGPQDNKSKGKEKKKTDEVPTAMGLVAIRATSDCIFCGQGHKSQNCPAMVNVSRDEKSKQVRDANACFRCLIRGHHSDKCDKDIKCSNPDCKKKDGHYAIMCFGKPTNTTVNYTSVPPPPQVLSNAVMQPPHYVGNPFAGALFPAYQVHNPSAPPKQDMNVTNMNGSQEVLLPTLTVGVRDVNGEIWSIRAALDTMSGNTYMTKSVVERLGVPHMSTEVFRHAVFGGGVHVVEHKKYEIELLALDWNFSRRIQVYDQDMIASGIPSVPPQHVVVELQRHGIYVGEEDQRGRPIDLLIGSDFAGSLVTGQQFQMEIGLTAIQTMFGWTVIGRPFLPRNELGFQAIQHNLVNLQYPEALWKLEMVGITDNATKLSKEEELKAIMDQFRSTVVRNDDGRFCVALPWVKGHPRLPSNRKIAEKRLEGAIKRLRQQEMYDAYEAIFEGWLEEGIISEVIPVEGEAEHYLPHRPVFKPSSATTKVRPVFDASCRSFTFGPKNKKIEHPSLNDCTHTGPNMLDQIPNLLLRFMEDDDATEGDIEKAFHMVEVMMKDRPFLRFLWPKRRGGGYRVFQHNRLVMGANSSPFLLNAVLQMLLEMERNEENAETIEKLKKSLYVDNVATSLPGAGESAAMKKFKEESIKIMASGKFNLRAWESNRDSEIGPEPSRVLGMKWDRLRDELFCEVMAAAKEKKITKRTILSSVARVYDPLGMLAAVVMKPKVMLQQCWKLKLQWDEEVPEEIKQEFLKWQEEMANSNNARIPRHIGVPTGGSSMHVFCDASTIGYAAVVFLRLVKEGKATVKFVMCRARVAPTVETTINRLELIACEIATRLGNTVREALGWHHVPVWYWTDSTTAKSWIQRQKEWGTFVGNRVTKIRALTSAEDWYHVPGVLNPADLPSRGCGLNELLETGWLQGPAWLQLTPDHWPGGSHDVDEEAVNRELKKSAMTLINMPLDESWYSPKKCRFGSFRTLTRMTGWMLRFKTNCKKKKDKEPLVRGPLSFKELVAAEKKLFLIIQRDSNVQEEKLSVETMERDGLICVKTKLTYRQDTEDFKFPVLLPGKHYLTDLLIQQEHWGNCHAGVQFLLAHLREQVWIVGGRKACTKILKECYRCRRFFATHPDPVTAPLPENRIKDALPFEVTGIDFAGPLYLKGNVKTWICLYTCAIFRAVHLELVDHLTTDAFLQSFRMFIARRGRPSVVYTDNGTNFVGASRLLTRIDWERISRTEQCQAIEWKFNPPAAPWWGGFFERLVRSMKELLVRVLGRQVLEKTEMQAILCDVEATLNGRPLTYVHENDDFIPLTPAMFLHGPRMFRNPELDQLDRESAVKRYRFRQKLMDDLRERFRKEYLGTLVQRRKDEKDVSLAVGDVVMIGCDNMKRVMWPLGTIKEFIAGRDGIFRLARLQTKNGEMIRAIQRLYPLELAKEYVDAAPLEVQEAFKTKAGRIVHRPDRLNLN